MYKSSILFICLTCFMSCQDATQKHKSSSLPNSKMVEQFNYSELDDDAIDKLAQMPLECANTEYPNKLSQTIGSRNDLKTPKELHPAFYGCFDWHSAVHGHWSMVTILKQYPNIASSAKLKSSLKEHISADNIQLELAYFKDKINKGWERTYGWAWLLKLAEELHTWEDPLARKLESNLNPLADFIALRLESFLPKLKYPIRVGTHTNTAFGLAFAHDYAMTMNKSMLADVIKKRALDFYIYDVDCPLDWEPSGYDFLSPCLEEMDLMRRVLKKDEFELWMKLFLPQLLDPNYHLDVGEVADRTDGHLVHLDGVNFSRAWCFYGLANQYNQYNHLINIANEHMLYSLPKLVGDSYEGGHWLGTFAIYALNCSNEK